MDIVGRSSLSNEHWYWLGDAFEGLGCYDVRKDTYERVLLQAVLQEIMDEEYQKITMLESARIFEDVAVLVQAEDVLSSVEYGEKLGEVAAAITGAGPVLDETTYVISHGDLYTIFDKTQQYIAGSPGWVRVYDSVFLGLSAINIAIQEAQLDKELSYEVIITILQRELLYAEAQTRLNDLGNYLDSISQTESIDPALMDAIGAVQIRLRPFWKNKCTK